MHVDVVVACPRTVSMLCALCPDNPVSPGWSLGATVEIAARALMLAPPACVKGSGDTSAS